MATPVMMPRQGQSVESCILGQWHKEVGESINEGDILFSYETDKASFEEEAKADGILLAIFFEEGEEIPVLTNVAVIGAEGESVEAFRPGADEEAAPAEEETASEEAPKVVEFEVSESNAGGRIRISPLARKMAEAKGIDINTLKGSGPHGRIIARDVEAVQETAPAPTPQATASAPKAAPAPAPILESGDDFDIKP